MDKQYRRKLLEKLRSNFEEAVRIAEKYGRIIGWVSRTSPSRIDKEGGYVVFDVEPETYFSESIELASSGNYLAVVDLRSLRIISLRVLDVERRDVLAELDIPELSINMPRRDVSGLLTKTRIKAKPLLAYDPFNDVVEAANYVIEPQSPVIKPLDEKVTHRILGLPDRGVFIGYATVGDKPIFNLSAEVYLPVKTFYQHVLILGTTGSGKTTLLKNMIASISSRYNFGSEDITVIIMDPNRDYVSLPLRPSWVMTSGLDIELEKEMINHVKDKVRHPRGLVILVPITRDVVESNNLSGLSWAKALMEIGKRYFEETYQTIADRMGWRIRIRDAALREEPSSDHGRIPLRYVYFDVEVDYGDLKDSFELFIVPYGFRFRELSTREFIMLNPFFTRQARDALLRVMNYLRSRGIELESIDELYEALRETRYYYEKKNKQHNITNPRIKMLVELITDLAVHKSTVENMIRQVGSLIETGLFDIMVEGGRAGDKYLHEPPIPSILVNHHSVFKGYPIVFDLEYLQEHSISDPEKVISIAAFRVLNKVFEWKLVSGRRRIRTQPVIIIIDEAHRFFPSRGGGREDYIEHVSSMIDRIARLGRARRLGLIFSTHSPRDVHDIILQLTNTKIILRMDKSQIQVLDIPAEYREIVLRSSDRVGVIKSHILRMGYISFRTPLPLTGHYDLSILE